MKPKLTPKDVLACLLVLGAMFATGAATYWALFGLAEMLGLQVK